MVIFIKFRIHKRPRKFFFHPSSGSPPRKIPSSSSNRSMSLLSERTSFRQSGFSSGRLAQDCGATGAHYDRLCVTEYRRDLVASRTLHIHEIGVGTLHQALQLAFSTLLLHRRMQKIFSKRHSEFFYLPLKQNLNKLKLLNYKLPPC